MKTLLVGLLMAGSPSVNAASLEVPGVKLGPPINVTYQCPGNPPLKVTYRNGDNGQSYALMDIDGKPLLLVDTIAGSGVRYAAGSIVWWNKGKGGDLYDTRKDPDKPIRARCMSN